MAINGGQQSKKLSYKDQVLELTYEGGSPCAANPNLKHKTVINFICRLDDRIRGGSSQPHDPDVDIIHLLLRPPKMGSENPEPVLIDSDSQTCTHFFSFHTPQACEQTVSVFSVKSRWSG